MPREGNVISIRKSTSNIYIHIYIYVYMYIYIIKTLLYKTLPSGAISALKSQQNCGQLTRTLLQNNGPPHYQAEVPTPTT